MEDKRVVVGYIRVSTKEQAETKLSIINQEEKIRAFATAHDMKVSRIFNDAAESAKDLNRPAVQEMLKGVQDGRIGHVIIYKLDRLTRNLENLGALIRVFEKHGVALKSVQESLDTSSASGRMVVNLLGMIAQWERETIAERTQVALDVKRRNNEKLGGRVPFGYKVKATPEGKVLVPYEPEQAIVRGILKARKEGRGYQDIALALDEQGVKCRKAKRWYTSLVRDICLRAGVQREKRRA